jgi:hypothetical protein
MLLDYIHYNAYDVTQWILFPAGEYHYLLSSRLYLAKVRIFIDFMEKKVSQVSTLSNQIRDFISSRPIKLQKESKFSKISKFQNFTKLQKSSNIPHAGCTHLHARYTHSEVELRKCCLGQSAKSKIPYHLIICDNLCQWLATGRWFPIHDL